MPHKNAEDRQAQFRRAIRSDDMLMRANGGKADYFKAHVRGGRVFLLNLHDSQTHETISYSKQYLERMLRKFTSSWQRMP
ncbi:MAG: hypothetical protein KGH64_01115 [Candidatus Micrarchaeota archaeon]|nr:hypothetical protein [Candidatus Micrarchaeota archaeon]MDE1833917.1 hypothetical protein [Candidatus Micrarchaeota archaeon]MDE1859807.1 hypothetical protein [Candidatus Micrarchaeota archaeon]